MSKRYEQSIPYGWYAIAYSKDLAAGEVKPLQYFGREIVLFRTESGEARVLDAYCPHLGAHLGHGGHVEGESISCPFHAWKYDGAGMCTDVPYAKRMPPKVDGKKAIQSYPVVEDNQMIWVWYHPNGVEPLWDLEHIEELHSDEWSEMQTYRWVINTIAQETGENAADLAHFVTVHGASDMPEGVVTMEAHMRTTIMDSDTASIDENGAVDRENTSSLKLVSWNAGPGQTYQRFSRMFDIVMMGTVTPIDNQSLELRFNFILPIKQTEEHQLYSHGVRDEIVHQVEQDMPIWENKKYLAAPILCDGDGPIAKYRKWFQQFYVAG